MSERRRYFRIDDEFEVRFVPSNGGPRVPATVPDDVRELTQALTRLRLKLPEAADAIELIARRVGQLERRDDPGVFSPAEVLQGANISGCGLAFHSGRPLPAGQLLDLDLYFDGGAVHLQATGKVVTCEPAEAPARGYLVGADFAQIAPQDEETLVQYVLRRQLRQLRRDRDLRERIGDG